MRLERINPYFALSNIQRFQFHKGAIRTRGVEALVSVHLAFQFHKGAIRTNGKYLSRIKLNDFNSIKVRLELNPTPESSIYKIPFQFHKGAIRTQKLVVFDSCNADFNSIKVRLELGALRILFTLNVNFNSIKVRLELLLLNPLKQI